LLAKIALPTIREIRTFALDNGLAQLTAASRDKAIFPLLKDLSQRPTAEVKAIV